MNAAIYARKSTEQEGIADKAKSVDRQEEGARAFITARGWSLDDAHVYIDDGVSGALFLGRPEFQEMLHDAATGAFEVVVLFDLDRFGRDGQKSMEALNALAATACRCGTTRRVRPSISTRSKGKRGVAQDAHRATIPGPHSRVHEGGDAKEGGTGMAHRQHGVRLRQRAHRQGPQRTADQRA